MIGKAKNKEITQKRELIEELRAAVFDKIKVFDNAASASDVENYIRQNRQLQHSIVVVSHR
jgi:hypothetical protein